MSILGLVSSSPWAIVAKIGAVVALLVGVYIAGYRESTIHSEAAQQKATAAALVKYEQDVAAYQAQVLVLQQDSAAAAKAAQVQDATLNGKIAALKRENASAKLDQGISGGVTVQLDPRPFTTGFVKLWNAATDAANGAEGVPADTTGTPGAPGEVTDVTRPQLLDVHAEAMRLCGKWRNQLNSIIDFQEKHP